MELRDWLTVIAILIAPLFAVQVTQFLDRSRHKRDAQLRLFATLMSTRAVSLSPQHVNALNLIDVVFYSRRDDDKQIRNLWKQYLDHLGTDQSQNPNW